MTTRAALRGVHMPFTTVQGGLEYGAHKVEEYAQMQMQQQAMQQQGVYNQIPNTQGVQTTPVLDLEELGTLNFTDFLDDFEMDNQKDDVNLEVESKQAQDVADDKDNPTREDDFEIGDSLNLENDSNDSQDIGEEVPQKSNGKKRSVSKSKSKSRSSKVKGDKKTKSVKISQMQQETSKPKIASVTSKQNGSKSKTQDSKEKEPEVKTKKVVTSRTTDITYKNDYTGQEIGRQKETVRNQSVDDSSGKSNGLAPTPKAPTIDGKIAEARAGNLVMEAAMITHQTGRPTEFKIGNDVVKFERTGQDTFAYKNGEKVSLEDAQKALKNLGQMLGSQKMKQLESIVKTAQVNPSLTPLHKGKTEQSKTISEQTNTTKQQTSKVVKIHTANER